MVELAAPTTTVWSSMVFHTHETVLPAGTVRVYGEKRVSRTWIVVSTSLEDRQLSVVTEIKKPTGANHRDQGIRMRNSGRNNSLVM
jgi:hypothetical protein